MNQPDLDKIDAARLRVVAAASGGRLDELKASLDNVLWTLAEVRPDFEKLEDSN